MSDYCAVGIRHRIIKAVSYLTVILLFFFFFFLFTNKPTGALTSGAAEEFSWLGVRNQTAAPES